MNKLFLSIGTALSLLVPFAASAAPFTAKQFETRTTLSARWENPEIRPAILAKIRENQTNRHTGETNEVAVDHNGTEIESYSQAVRCILFKQACRNSSTSQDAR